MAKEIWKEIPSFDGMYEVSSEGRIRSYNSRGGRQQHFYIIKGYARPNGYLETLLSKDHKTYHVLVHRMILLAFRGPAPDGMECAHLDGNKHNNRINNLAWVTPQENCAHKEIHGTSPKGKRNPKAILVEEDIPIIRKRLQAGEFARVIAFDFGVSGATISDIKIGRRWKHV